LHRIPKNVADAVDAFLDASDKRSAIEQAWQELNTDHADMAIADLLERSREDEESLFYLRNMRYLLGCCRKEGIECTFETPLIFDEEIEEAVDDFVNANGSDEAREVFKKLSRLLLSPEAVRVLEVMVLFFRDDTKLRNRIEERRRQLQKCQQGEIDQAFPPDLEMAIPKEDPGRQQLELILGHLAEAFELHDFRRQVGLLRTALNLPMTEQVPELWAALHHHLGAALSQCPGEDRYQLIEESLQHHRLAMTAFPPDSKPLERAQNLLAMGNAYSQRPGGSRSENLEQAISCYEGCVELFVRIKGIAPLETYISLADVYTGRIKGIRSENIEKSIEYLSLARNKLNRKKSPLDWADVNLNLGNALLQRIEGERADNIERAIVAFDHAYQVYKAAVSRDDRLGSYHLGIMNAYVNRVVGARDSNIQKAISHTQEAIRALPRNDWPEKWAEAYIRLASLYEKEARGEDQIRKAIECYEHALEVFDREKYPYDWAKVQLNMGVTWARNFRQKQCVEKAIACYSSAVEVYTQLSFPEHWSKIHHNWAQLYASMDSLSEDEVSQTEEHFRLALEARPADLFPHAAFETQKGLARFYFRRRLWERADTTLHGVLSTAESIFASSHTHDGRIHELGTISGLYPMHAFCLLRLGRKREALARLEEGKTRLLSEALALSEVDATMLSEADHLELSSARATVQQAETNFASVIHHTTASEGPEADHLRTARQNLSRAISSIRRRAQEFLPTGVSPRELSALVPIGGAVVMLFVTQQGGGAFLLPHGVEQITDAHVLEIEDLNASTLRSLLFGENELRDSAAWFKGYSSLHSGRGFSSWQAVLSDLTSQIWHRLMGQVTDRLTALGIPKGAPVVLIPQGGLGILPLHAAWREEGGERHYFSDDYVVSYVPSGFAWTISQRRNRTRDYDSGISLLAVVNPTLDLPFASVEGDEISTSLQWDRCVLLNGEAATPEEVLKSSSGISYVHFACHGSYDWIEPMTSRLELAGKKALLLRDVIKRMDLHSCRLVVLSACETGLTEFQRAPDEFLGLPSGFLQAGAPAVIGSLWPVSDFSTMLLMRQFYKKHLLEKLAPSEALHGAQRWLRNATNKELAELFHDLRDSASDRPRMSYAMAREQFQKHLLDPAQNERPYAHPHYWAAFTFTGA
jgi:CHAT domain-containing protein/tetratricopeptide (TPR) repeat protein